MPAALLERAQSHRTRREAAQNTMASFAGDDYALERRKLRELQASVSRSTNPAPIRASQKGAGADQRWNRRCGRGGDAVASGPQGRGHAPGGGD